MKTVSTLRVNELFEEALQLEGEACAEFLARLEDREPLVAAKVGHLLVSLAEAEGKGFLDTRQPPLGIEKQETIDPSGIGPYRIIEVLGRGGMATVYLAEQTEPVTRKVALKLVHRRSNPEKVLRRFETEKQLLAFLDHRHITRLYDFGTTESGDSYFAMEYVPGPPITAFCDSRRLPLRERLRLFREVCEAVHHAHQKGIIHCDIKPGNVLVKMEDGLAVPKIIDFGIARVTLMPGSDQPTSGGDTLIGTPAYMSPEQVLAPGDIDTRSDIYSLGALLHCLLIGFPPMTEKGQFPQMTSGLKMHSAEIPLPSSRLTAGCKQDEKAAKHRRTTVGSLATTMRGDLDRIVLKAMARERERRYGSAAELARDIHRHLNHQPISAMPPNTRYRISRFLRRHRWAVTAVSTVILALLVGLSATAMALYRTREAEAKARHSAVAAGLSAQKARAAFSVLQDILAASDPVGQGTDIRVSELLARFPKELPDDLIGGETEALLRHTIGRTYTNLGKFDSAREQLEAALAIRNHLYGPSHPDSLETSLQLAYVLAEEGKLDESEQLSRSLLAMTRSQFGPDHELSLRALISLATAYMNQRRFKQAQQLCEEALPLSRELYGNEHRTTITIYDYLGQTALNLRNGEDSENYLAMAHKLSIVVHGEKHPQTLDIAHNYLNTKLEMGKPEEVIPEVDRLYAHQEEIRGANHPYTLGALGMKGHALLALGAFHEAEAAYRQLLERGQNVFGSDNPRLAYCLIYLGRATYASGKYQEAVQCFERAFPIEKKAFGVNSPRLAVAHFNLGTALRELGGRDGEARLHLERARDLFREQENSAGLLPVMRGLAVLEMKTDRPTAARKAFAEAAALASANILPPTGMITQGLPDPAVAAESRKPGDDCPAPRPEP